MDTAKIREEAGALLAKAETALGDGNVDEFGRIMDDARAKMDSADSIDKAASELKVLQGDFQRPLNTVPVASNDVAVYDAEDTTARTKADYKPASWVKGLPASAQPIWVQEKMGTTQKEEAQFQTDTFVKWMRAGSDDIFWKTASLDEVKAMQEDTDAEGKIKSAPLSSVTM